MTTESRAQKKSTVVVGWVISIVASLLIDAAAVFAAVRIVEFRSQLAAELEGGPSVAPTVPGITSTPTPSPAPGDPRVPPNCEAVFSRAMVGALTKEGLELETLKVPSGGTNDAELLELLDGSILLECDWHEADGGVETGIRSSIAVVAPEQQRAAIERLLELRMTRLEELDGTRYFVEGEDADGTPMGESHFFRDGLWFATHWFGHGPYGYTADLARSVFS